MKITILTGILSVGLIMMAVSILAPDTIDAALKPRFEKATFAGGCFWCMEPPFDKLEGVKSVISGYTGGHKKNPTYEEVSSGITGHAEAIEVTYDPAVISYSKLLDVFWRNIDPTVKDRQFCDVGAQYRTAIWYHNEEQKRLAEESKKALEQSRRFSGPVYTEITKASQFYPAEEYHQKYYQKNPIRYKYYRFSCGRDQRLKDIWGNPY
jgi:peptide-methionine (S)-S-oxide reductase